MNILPLVVGDLHTNCYIVSDPSTSKCLIIDPGGEADFISTTILELKLNPVGVVLTHGHYDHCLGVLELKLNFDIPIYLHKDDLFLYKSADKSASHWTQSLRSNPQQPNSFFKLPPIDSFLQNDQILTFGESSLRIIHTPGHTPGSICLLSSQDSESHQTRVQVNPTPPILFTGDTLFADTIGRTDLSYSSNLDLKKSLHLIQNLAPNALIYPGHEDFGIPMPAFEPH